MNILMFLQFIFNLFYSLKTVLKIFCCSCCPCSWSGRLLLMDSLQFCRTIFNQLQQIVSFYRDFVFSSEELSAVVADHRLAKCY